jgi:hypothetical protein
MKPESKQYIFICPTSLPSYTWVTADRTVYAKWNKILNTPWLHINETQIITYFGKHARGAYHQYDWFTENKILILAWFDKRALFVLTHPNVTSCISVSSIISLMPFWHDVHLSILCC